MSICLQCYFIQKCIQNSNMVYTPYQLVYGLHPLMPIDYIVPVVGGDEKDSTPVRVLISIIIELKKLQETKMQSTKTTRIEQ